MYKLYKNVSKMIRRKKRGYSAITPAIIIIGFITLTLLFVAFLLNSGYYAMDSMENVVSDASDEASTLLKLDGDISVQTGDKGSDVQVIKFAVRLLKGSREVRIDSESTAISMMVKRDDSDDSDDWASSNIFTDNLNGKILVQINALVGTYTDIYDAILEQGEIFEISISIAPESAPSPHNYQLDPLDTLNVGINLGQGPILSFNRQLPEVIDGIVSL